MNPFDSYAISIICSILSKNTYEEFYLIQYANKIHKLNTLNGEREASSGKKMEKRRRAAQHQTAKRTMTLGTSLD